MMESTSVITSTPASPSLTTSSMSSMAIPSPAPATTTTKDGGPLPMSFPAILRGSGISDRFAHLRAPSTNGISPVPVALKKNRRDEKEGKRWIRRKENARFIGNGHIVAATKHDFAVPVPSARATFPQPLPNYLQRNNPIPAAEPTACEPISASAGRFSLSLKGMRRELRKSGPRTQVLVKEIEHEVSSWLAHGVWLNPDAQAVNLDPAYGTPVGTMGAIIEVARLPSQLIWSVNDDNFARYVVHCCARYHNIVSFSKEASGSRLTYLLRPHSAQPTFSVPQGLDTPPVTDLESALDPESDFAFSDRDSHANSNSDAESEFEGAPPVGAGIALSDIAESTPASPALEPIDSAWSILGESDADTGDEQELASSVSSLELDDNELTPRAPIRLRQQTLRSRMWERQRRSASSPSRSPARRASPRVHPRIEPPVAKAGPQSFYDYLFS